jgi:hypothetical protein
VSESRAQTCEIEGDALMSDLVSRPAHTSRGTFGYTYQKEALRYVAMPLGGIGAGQVALGGDGGLRQWQIVNQINHQGFVPASIGSYRLRATGDVPCKAVKAFVNVP